MIRYHIQIIYLHEIGHTSVTESLQRDYHFAKKHVATSTATATHVQLQLHMLIPAHVREFFAKHRAYYYNRCGINAQRNSIYQCVAPMGYLGV